jgi:DNA-binding CsgD family transcriptional regulator
VIGSLVSPRFVGRGAELQHLLDEADRVRAGTSATLLLGGEAGVGKSRLVSELSGRLVEDGWRVLRGQCVELGGDGLPLAPLADVLRTLARTSTPSELDAFLGAARRELVWLLPELGDETAAAGGASQAQLLELVLGMVSRLGRERPLLLVVEDLHWADRSTLELVAFLVRALRGSPVMVLMTYRSDELHRRHPLRPLLTTWERGRSVSRIELARLTRDEVAEQLAGILDEDAPSQVVDAVYERSQGNAYFVEEVLGIIQAGRLPDDLPPSLRDVLLTHLELLPEDAQRVLRAASAAGTSVPERLLASVVDLDRDQLSAALREIVEHHLLLVDDTIPGYAFRHALTRDAVYHDMLPGERVQLHASYGAALTAEPEVAGRSVAALLAHHWYAALDLPRALAAAIDAGRESVTHAPADAQKHFERALEVWPRVWDAEQLAAADHVAVLGESATAAYNAGATDRCLQLLDQALAEQPAGADDVRRALILEERARALRDVGRETEGFAVLHEALALVPREPPSAARAKLLAAMANSTLRLGDLERCAGYAAQAVEAGRASGAEEQEADGSVSLGSALINLGQTEVGLEAVRDGLEQAKRLGARIIVLRAYVNLSDSLESLCRHAEAAETAREGQRHAEEYGATRITSAYLAGNLAEPLLRLGRWDEASRIATTALEHDRDRFFAGTLLELLSQLALFRGDHDQARVTLREALAALAGDSDVQYTLPLAFIEAELARAGGDPDLALEVIDRAMGEHLPNWPRYRWPLVWETARCTADLRNRARDRREQVPDAVEASAARWARYAEALPADTSHASAYRALTLAEHAGSGAAAPASWFAAVEACRLAEDPYLVAYALGRQAESATTTGERDLATAALQESLQIARRLGATPLVQTVDLLARRARLELEGPVVDEPAPTEDTLGHLGLTERERDVLALIAAGQPNAQIARSLFISPKTVSVHVSNILAKLQVRSRVEAAAVAHRNGVFGPER